MQKITTAAAGNRAATGGTHRVMPRLKRVFFD